MPIQKKIFQEAGEHHLSFITRRHFLQECRTGMGMMALGSLIGGCDWLGSKHNVAAQPQIGPGMDPLAPKAPQFPGKAKAVIYLHMAGAPSQL